MQPGTLLADRYRLEDAIATGGMGVVYAATDLATNRSAAIKVLKKELLAEPRFVERLRREARAVSSLAHPNIVEVTDLVIEQDRAFLVMERLQGDVFGMAISDSPNGLPQATVVKIGRQLLSALDAAHRAGIIHRDVKPDNVFLEEKPPGELNAKLLDFGLAKLETAAKLTASHSVLGTWQYMAPEQARGERTDGRADVYSVGACLYYALTKKRPYQAADVEAATFALSEQVAPPVRSMRSDLDPAFAAVIERALSKDVIQRFQSAREMRDALKPFEVHGPRAAIEPEPEDEDIQTAPVKGSAHLRSPRRPPAPPFPMPGRSRTSAPPPKPPLPPSPSGSNGSVVDVVHDPEGEHDTLKRHEAKEIDRFLGDSARDNTLDSTFDRTLEGDDQTTPRQPASRDPRDDKRPPPIEPEPESARDPHHVEAAAPPFVGQEPPRRPLPSRNRWRPPQKVRAGGLLLPLHDEHPLEPTRRPHVMILVVFGIALFAAGLALGRLLLG